MGFCSCGNVTDDTIALCARCAALRILGLEAGATAEEIRSNYHVLAKVWHPHRFQHDPELKVQADEKLKAINSAFRILTSKSARKERRRETPVDHGSSGNEPSSRPGLRRMRARSERLGWIPFLKAISFPAIVMACAGAAALGVIGWILFKPIDRFLSSEPLIAGPYEQYKSEVQSTFG